MKRIALILLTLIVGFAFVRADNPWCTRYFVGNRGYVKVYYNRSDNKLEISSQTGMNIRHIAELQIKVTCTHKWQSRGIRERGTGRVKTPAKWNEEQVTICDSRYTNIPVNKSISLSNGLADLPQDSNTDYFENFNVTISSPLLSSENEITTSPNPVPENRESEKENKNSASEKTNSASEKTNGINNNSKSESKPNFVCESLETQSQGNFCDVKGSSNSNAAYLSQTRVVSDKYGDVYVEIKLKKPAKETTYVTIVLYDENGHVGTDSKEIYSGYKSVSTRIRVSQSSHTYKAKIIEASAE